MKKTLKDLIMLLLPMGSEKRKALAMAGQYLNDEERRLLRYYLKIDRTFASIQKFGTTPVLFEDKEWPLFKSHLQEPEVDKFIAGVNAQVVSKAQAEAFLLFAPHALDRITARMAPHIVGLDAPKTAAAAQLFAKEPFHILLLGDPGTGKTDLLRSVSNLTPKGSFGLGSGTSGAGLSAMAKGDQVIKGLLPLADGGIACIDELNLMKSRDIAALYNAMEKGFVSYDKGGTHEQLAAHVRVCATANPKEDTFIGKSAEILKKQMPFDDALLSRFHLLFIIRKPNAEEFVEITQRIVESDTSKAGAALTLSKEDIVFIKAYIEHAWDLDVQLDPHMQSEITDFIRGLKENERQFIVEIGPRTVVGIIRLAKAFARAEMAEAADERHLKQAFDIATAALYVRKADGRDDAPRKKGEGKEEAEKKG